MCFILSIRPLHRKAPGHRLDMLLYSNNPGVSKPAPTAMDPPDRGAATERAEQAMGRNCIYSETAFALRLYVSHAGTASSADSSGSR
jgi:hypothetical protein